MADKPPTSAQLKDDIEGGRSGDKVRHFDPAAVPLGTDEEAAGTPPSPIQLAQERERMSHMGHQSAAELPKPSEARSGARAAFGLPLLFLIVLIAVGIGLAVFSSFSLS